MPLYDVFCGGCGREAERWAKVDERYVTCENCGAATERVWRTNTNSRHADVTWPGGKTFTNGFSSPQTFYSPKEYREALAAKGLRVQGGGEESFAWMSKETLTKAEEIVRRVHARDHV